MIKENWYQNEVVSVLGQEEEEAEEEEKGMKAVGIKRKKQNHIKNLIATTMNEQIRMRERNLMRKDNMKKSQVIRVLMLQDGESMMKYQKKMITGIILVQIIFMKEKMQVILESKTIKV